ncbi:type II toxin-antitoxin system RelE/ParE family toxin [Erwinia mallotivora]|uniref:type II toxin-antitoxin system RelE/ParE family toxin n=1 Tax=Erwinia mallotivora TaxID=69222 RepID=UPI0035F0C228
MKVRWTKDGLEDRLVVWDYLVERNPVAAATLDDVFNEAADRLGDHPLMGVPGKIAGTRELVPHEHYRLTYEIDAEKDTVWILALIHTARLWPPVTED